MNDNKKNIIAITIMIVLFLAIVSIALVLLKGVDNIKLTNDVDTQATTATPTTSVVSEGDADSTDAPSEEKTDEPDATEDPVASKYTFTELDKEMYAQSNVNVRKEPCKEGEQVGALGVNKKVKVTGQCNETQWYRIEYNETTAYVSNKYLADTEYVAPTQEATPEPTKEATPEPTVEPTKEPTVEPTKEPTKEPTPEPTVEPTKEPTPEPTKEPVEEPVVDNSDNSTEEQQ